MLRKKLSGIVLSSLVGVMFVGVGGSNGQAVKARGAQVISESYKKSVTQETILNAINNTATKSIDVSTDITLDDEIVEALNNKGDFTINVLNGGTLNITSSVNLNNSQLKIVRAQGNNNPIVKIGLSANTREIAKVMIDGVIFDDANKNVKSQLIDISPLVAGKTVTISNVTISGGALLRDQNPSVTVSTKTIAQDALLYVNGQINGDVSLNPINLNGTTLNIKGTAPGGSTVTVEIKDGQNIVKTIDVKSDNNGNFSTTYDGDVNKSYTVVAKTNNGTISQSQTVNTNSSVKISVKDITSNTATIELTYGTGIINYPLTLTIKDSSNKSIAHKIENNKVRMVTVKGLSANTTYTYELTDSANPSNKLVSGSFTTKVSSTITGGEGSAVVTDISSNDINRANISDVSIAIPISNKALASGMEGGKDFKVDIKGASVEFKNGELILRGLVPEKEYKNTTLTYVDKNGRTKTVKIPTFKTKVSETKLRQFIKDVYTYSLGRTPDEEGFAYWEKQLSGKMISPQDFVKNLLSEKEFINKYTKTEEKIEALYQVIVNRKSDAEGLKFWVDRYNDLIKQGFSEETALSIVVDEMVNEAEFKSRVKELGL